MTARWAYVSWWLWLNAGSGCRSVQAHCLHILCSLSHVLLKTGRLLLWPPALDRGDAVTLLPLREPTAREEAEAAITGGSRGTLSVWVKERLTCHRLNVFIAV